MWFPFLIIYLLYALVVTIYFTKLIYRELAFTLLDTTNVPTRWLPFVRLDRQNWRMWEIYLGALTIMPIRILLGLVMLSICLTSMVIAGHGMKVTQEWSSFRYKIVKQIVTFMFKLFLFICGFYDNKVNKVKYSDFNPEHVQSDSSKNEIPTIIVSNHVSWWDSLILIGHYMPSFLAKIEVLQIPLIGTFSALLKSIYVVRESRDNKDLVLNQIKERVDLINKGELFPPLVIFPEGTTTNGHHLLTFRRGAFESLAPVKITCLRYYNRNFNLALDNVGMPGVLIALTQIYNKVQMYEFEGLYEPTFLSDVSLTQKERSAKYADSTRAIISKCLKIQTTSEPSNSTDTWDYHYHLFPQMRPKKD